MKNIALCTSPDRFNDLVARDLPVTQVSVKLDVLVIVAMILVARKTYDVVRPIKAFLTRGGDKQ